MDRRKFLKLAASLPIIGILPRLTVQRIFGSLTQHTSNGQNLAEPRGASRSAAWDYAGQINFRQIDESTLGEWWAALCGLEMPKEFGDVPKSVNERDYLRGAFRIVNAICPRDVAMMLGSVVSHRIYRSASSSSP